MGRRILTLAVSSFLFLSLAYGAEKKEKNTTLTMVFVPASEKAQANEFDSLLEIV